MWTRGFVRLCCQYKNTAWLKQVISDSSLGWEVQDQGPGVWPCHDFHPLQWYPYLKYNYIFQSHRHVERYKISGFLWGGGPLGCSGDRCSGQLSPDCWAAGLCPVSAWMARGLRWGNASPSRGCPLLFSGAEATLRVGSGLPADGGLRSKVRVPWTFLERPCEVISSNPRITDGETEAQRGQVSWLWSQLVKGWISWPVPPIKGKWNSQLQSLLPF